jgi:hypothetical protein
VKRPSAGINMNLFAINKKVVHGYRHEYRRACNAVEQGKLLGQKPRLTLKEIWAIRIRMQLDHRARERCILSIGCKPGDE